ncbi:MAG: fatty acid desaturase [Candidatus Brocadiae bacterium]|nr:fatty acid desaturase [Candidatus Brocadiia bacterium]
MDVVQFNAARGVERKVSWLNPLTLIFYAVHVAALGVFFFPFSWKWVLLAAALYVGRMFVVTAGYHRYFSHRTFTLDRVSQFLLAFLAQTSGQKGVLWWAANHREHHRHSDQETDHHSPIRDGFFWSHVGWIISQYYDSYDPKQIPDFHKYPELRFLDRFHYLCPVTLAAAITLIWGWPGLFWGFFLSTVILYHGTFTINSLCHVWGSRRFPTTDTSRNNFWLALITMGEGWHNNHHWYQHSCRQGIRWYEVDMTWYGLKALSFIGIVRNMRPFRHAPEVPAPQPQPEPAPAAP